VLLDTTNVDLVLHGRGLLSAARIMEEDVMPRMVRERYASFDTGFGKVRPQWIGSLLSARRYVPPDCIESFRREIESLSFRRILSDRVNI
jgi:xylose isomerase